MNSKTNRYQHRHSTRLKGYDYTLPGAYFVTLVAWQRESLFGEIKNSKMRLNQFGEIIRDEWLHSALIRENVEIYEGEFVIMPNHLHGIIWIVDKEYDGGLLTNVGATCLVAPTKGSRIIEADTHKKTTTLISKSLGAIIGQFKTVSAKRINAMRDCCGIQIWQRNYYDHIIRNELELETIHAYIRNNPINWENDTENPTKLEVTK
jgi:putative transposase